jgi:hypothetical protein
VIGYTYDADYHCTDCTINVFGEDEKSPPVHRWATRDAVDSSGESVSPIFADSEWYDPYSEESQVLSCGTCGDTIDRFPSND